MIALFNRIWRDAGGAGALMVLVLLFSTPSYAGNNATFSSQSVPTTMAAGGAYSVSVSMTNTGTTTWTSGTSHFLGSQNPQDNLTWGVGRAGLSGPVAPGQTATIAFQVTAPSTPGTYNFQWKMLQGGVEWFGTASPNVAVVVTAPSLVNSATVTAVSAPATMTPGQTYSVAVMMQNTGTTTWSAGGAYLLGSKNPDNNLTWGLKRVALSRSVVPGQRATFEFDVVAPPPGTYSMQWGMVQELVEWFGATASATVTVGGGTGETVTYIHTDGLGSPVARSDALGKVISRTRYEPYGLTAAGDVPSIGFTGHVNDADTGLVYMQQRYYDPVAGRFLSIDPVTTDSNTGSSFNRYAYTNNNPYRYVDPDGRSVLAAEIATLTVFGVGAWIYATDPKARAVMNRAFQSAIQPKADGEGATDEQKANSVGGPTEGKRVPSGLRDEILTGSVDADGNYTCWRCGGTSTDPTKIDIGHKNTPRSDGGNLHPDNLACEGQSCNRSAGNRGQVKPGSDCISKGCAKPPEKPPEPAKEEKIGKN